MRAMLAGGIFAAAMSIIGLSLYHPKADLPQPHCVEDEACWDCETMGNGVCGAVNVETWTDGSGSWVRVWDERGRLVFGPVLIDEEK